MKLVQFIEPGDGMRLGLVIGDEVLDLTGADQGPRTVHQLYYDDGGDEIGLVAAAQNLQKRAARRLPLDALLANRSNHDPYLTKPVSGPPGHPHALRVWLAGVTHEVSAKLREIEAQQATGEAINVYDQKYREVSGGGRPELFAKGEPDAVVGHGQPITRPGDTQRLVPRNRASVSLWPDAPRPLREAGLHRRQRRYRQRHRSRQSPQLAPSQKLGWRMRFSRAGVDYSRRVRRLRGRGLVPHLAQWTIHSLQEGPDRPEQPEHARAASALRAPSFQSAAPSAAHPDGVLLGDAHRLCRDRLGVGAFGRRRDAVDFFRRNRGFGKSRGATRRASAATRIRRIAAANSIRLPH